MSKHFWTSDLHLDHHAILEYTPRGEYLKNLYKDIHKEITPEIHANWVIDTINDHVGDKDHLYFLGDMLMTSNPWKAGELISRIKCVHKHLVFGNHDFNLIDFYTEMQKIGQLFETVGHVAETKLYGKRIVMFHYPIAEWNNGHHSSWHLHGHSHGNFDYEKANLHDKRILDVGWDNSAKVLSSYRPFEFHEIDAYMDGRISIDHHGKAD